MTFDLHIHGETPEELLDALAHLSVTTNIVNAAPAQPQSEAVTQPDKPKAPAPSKTKKAPQKPAAAPAETPANPTSAPSAGAAVTTADPAAGASKGAETPTTPAAAKSEPDPAALDKIRDLARSLIINGKQAEVRQLVQSTGAASLSKLPPESYTAVRDGLLKLKDEVDADAAG